MREKAASIKTTDGLTEPSQRIFSVGGHTLTAP
jgi:hypothetical protein